MRAMRGRAGMAAFWLLVGLVGGAEPVLAQESRAQESRTQQPGAHSPGSQRAYPAFSFPREAALTALGAGTLAWAVLPNHDAPPAPSSGYDPADIRWEWDRGIVGRRDVGANDASDLTRAAAVAFPFALVWATAGSERRWTSVAARSAVYVETLLVTSGLTTAGKVLWERPRPFVYLAEDSRPDDSGYDVTQARAFHAMPSGHASTAWAGAAFAVTDHLLARPDAPAWERLGIGFAGGLLAGTTAGLRVDAGQHFPSDVLAGSGLGIATGVVVPLLHRGEAPLPPARAWLESLGGVLGGTLLGVWVAR